LFVCFPLDNYKYKGFLGKIQEGILHKIAAKNLLILYIDKMAVRGERLRTATLKKIVVLLVT